jgi:hypothetical protein
MSEHVQRDRERQVSSEPKSVETESGLSMRCDCDIDMDRGQRRLKSLLVLSPIVQPDAIFEFVVFYSLITRFSDKML